MNLGVVDIFVGKDFFKGVLFINTKNKSLMTWLSRTWPFINVRIGTKVR